MKKLLWMWMVGFFAGEVTCLCGKMTTFDTLCTKDDVTYILSANPCLSEKHVSVTIMNMKNLSLYTHIKIDGDYEEPLPIFGQPGKGAVVIMVKIPVSDDPKDYRKTVLRVEIYLVDIKKYKSDAKRGDLIVEARFPMFTNKCMKKIKYKLVTHDSCHHKHALGEFSVLCVVLPKSKSNDRLTTNDPGAYILFTDMCTVPYSTRIIALLDSEYIVDKLYTQDKTDSAIQLTESGASKYGLFFYMHGHYGDHLHMKLNYGDRRFNITLIDAVLQTHSGLMCPLSKCTPTKVKPLEMYCKVPWISKKGAMLESHIEAQLKICKPAYSIWWNIHIKEPATDHLEFPFEEREVLQPGEMENLKLGYPRVLHDAVSSTDGYMWLGWGKISMYTKKDGDLVYLSVHRHYPYDNDTIPLFHTEYWLSDVDKTKICPPEDKSLETDLTIAGIALLVFVVVAVLFYRRRASHLRKRKGAGLPYQIHLAEEPAHELELDDEAQHMGGDMRLNRVDQVTYAART